MLGNVRECLGTIEQHLSRVDQLKHPQTLAMATAWTAPILEYLGYTVRSLDLANSSWNLAEELGLPQARWWAPAVRGWLLARRGDAEQGIELLRDSVATNRTLGLLAELPTILSWLAEALLLTGSHAASIEVADEGLEISGSTDLRLSEAELHRLRGEACQAMAGAHDGQALAGAEQAFLDAITVARSQRAKFVELRAVLSRCRFLVATGRHGDAWSALNPVCAEWEPDLTFTDLADARALLAQLSTIGET